MALPRDAQGPLEVPAELWTQPGIKRDRSLEERADREAPLRYFFTPVAKARFLRGLGAVLWFRIPSLASTLGREVQEWRGVWKYKTYTERCFPTVLNYKGCAVCMKVCPIQKFGLRKVLEHYRATGQILGKGTLELEGYELPGKGFYGPGELPTFRPEEFKVRGWEGPPTKAVPRGNGPKAG